MKPIRRTAPSAAITKVSFLIRRAQTSGFYGKIPARGDFVRDGLPRDFVDPWDAWLQRRMADSREALGQDWLPAWLEAPVWRFRLQPGICGACAVSGVLMPSVDRAGRHFPLTLACLAAPGEDPQDQDPAWLDQAEAAGIAAIERDLDPEALAAMLVCPAHAPAQGGRPPVLPAGGCVWWTAGAPRVVATGFATAALPDATQFAGMLQSYPADPPGDSNPQKR